VDQKRNWLNLSPTEYEIAVKKVLSQQSGGLQDFVITHNEVLPAHDGEYEIDIVVRFTILGGAAMTVFVECKQHKRAIKRDLVLALDSKKGSLGAHKAITVSTATYQRGAIEYAKAHGISLIRLVDSKLNYAVKARLVDAVEMTIDEDDNTAEVVVCSANAITPSLADLLDEPHT